MAQSCFRELGLYRNYNHNRTNPNPNPNPNANTNPNQLGLNLLSAMDVLHVGCAGFNKTLGPVRLGLGSRVM